jgi:hypothetical protein
MMAGGGENGGIYLRHIDKGSRLKNEKEEQRQMDSLRREIREGMKT